VEKLVEHHKNHLLPQFVPDEKAEDEQTIQILTEYITKMFHDCQTKIQRIGNQAVGPQEDQIKKNIQSALALQLQELSVQFRKSQKDYLQSTVDNFVDLLY
jgi:syntaxin 16